MRTNFFYLGRARTGSRLAVFLFALCMISAPQLFAAPLNAPNAGPEIQAVGTPAVPRATLNMKGENASDDVRLVADWIVRNDKQKGRPFIIADKVNGLLFAFFGSGELLAKTRALYGANGSDAMTKTQADKNWNELVAADMITPAGAFPAHGYRSPTYGPSIRFAEFAKSNLLVHRAPAEWRRKNLQSPTGKINVTYGCINVLPDFIDKVLLPVFSGESTVFIMPETQSPRSFFAIDDAPDTKVRTARN